MDPEFGLAFPNLAAADGVIAQGGIGCTQLRLVGWFQVHDAFDKLLHPYPGVGKIGHGRLDGHSRGDWPGKQSAVKGQRLFRQANHLGQPRCAQSGQAQQVS